jgi:hypothetical protein
MLASPQFDSYRNRFGSREPDLSRKQFEDETEDVSTRSDVYSLTLAPFENFVLGEPPNRARSSGTKMHIWLVKVDSVVTALEEGASGLATQRRRLAHSNLSGTNMAHCGGELWFRDDSSIWITGGSSRFPPQSAAELEEIGSAFRRSGYNVCNCGWDNEIDGPARFFRGNDTWLEKI